MFVQAFYKIKDKINKSTDKEKSKKALEEKLIGNDVLRTQYDIFNQLRENKQRIGSAKYKKFVDKVKETQKYSKEEINKEVTKLLEFFNIDPKTIKNTVVDNAMNLKESAIKKIVVDRKEAELKNEFRNLLVNESFDSLQQGFRHLRFAINKLDESKKIMFVESIKSLETEQYKNYESCVKKLYKLTKLSESYMTEGIKGAMKKFKFVKPNGVSPIDYTPRKGELIINIYIPVWLIGAVNAAINTSAKRVSSQLQRGESEFIRSCIIGSGADQFIDPHVGSWKVIVRSQNKIEGGGAGKARITIGLNVKDGVVLDLKQLNGICNKMLTTFNEKIPQIMGDQMHVLTPDAQKKVLANAQGQHISDKQRQSRLSGDTDRNLINQGRKPRVLDTNYGSGGDDDFGGMF